MIGHLLSWRSALFRERTIVSIDIDGLVGSPIQRLVIFITRWLEWRAERRSLQNLDDHMLKDIGISRCDVERELRARWSGE
jgi:uncharacterized protein YjiS (DUF1127 family)